MKKIFTILAVVLFAGVFSMNAAEEAEKQSVKFWTQTYNSSTKEYEYTYEKFTSDIIRNADGSYTITSLYESGIPLTFSFTPIVDDYADMTFSGNIYLQDGNDYPWVMDATGDDYAEWTMYEDATGDEVYVYYPYVCEDGYSYVYTYDKTDPDFDPSTDNDYYAVINYSGTAEDGGSLPWLYIVFWFNEMKIPTSNVAGIAAEENAPVEYFNLQGMRIAEPQNGIFIRRQGSKVQKVVR